jgi:hypothetical protein
MAKKICPCFAQCQFVQVSIQRPCIEQSTDDPEADMFQARSQLLGVPGRVVSRSGG